jgi:hypothetical protein
VPATAAATAALVAPVTSGPPAPTRTVAPAPTPTSPRAASEAQPQAVLPQDARPQRAVSKAPPSTTPHKGDLICGECGEGNAPTRRFCSRCGASLATATPVRIPWWRRLFPKRDRSKAKAGSAAGTAAGRRPKQKRRALPAMMRGVRGIISIVLLLGGIVYASYAPARTLVNEKVGALLAKGESIVHPQYVPEHPIEARANAAQPGHPATAVIDGFTNTYWAAPATGPEQVLVLSFDHPVKVSKALVRVGVSGNFGSTARPHAIHIVYSNGHSQELNLDDKAEAQEVTLKPDGAVTSIELHITSFYRPVSGTDIAVTEIELFSKK